MTELEAEFAAYCGKIAGQNRALLARLPEADFNPGLELDNTRNNAAYTLTDFFGVLKLFPYGEVPFRLADEALSTTDELIAAIKKRYPAENIRFLAHAVGIAFRRSKRIWRIRKPPAPMSQPDYAAALDECLEEILDALDDLNAALDSMASVAPPRARKTAAVHRPKDALTQSQVAHDLGVDRQTIVRWEKLQTVDGPDNGSNPYGYYKSLRTDAGLRGAYGLLVRCVRHYLRVREEAKRRNGATIRFVSFKEAWLKHQDGKPYIA